MGSDLEWTKFLSKTPVVDPLKDLTPIATVISSVNCVAVNAASPFKTFDDLAAFTKNNPGKLTYGTAGTLSYYYLMGQALKQHRRGRRQIMWHDAVSCAGLPNRKHGDWQDQPFSGLPLVHVTSFSLSVRARSTSSRSRSHTSMRNLACSGEFRNAGVRSMPTPTGISAFIRPGRAVNTITRVPR